MKKLFYSMPDFVVRFWCKFFKCSKIESTEQEVDKEADWDKMVDNLHQSAKQDPNNPNVIVINVVEDAQVESTPKKVENKTKLVKDTIRESFYDTTFTTSTIANFLIKEQNFELTRKDISRLLSKFFKKGYLKRFYSYDDDSVFCYVPTKRILKK